MIRKELFEIPIYSLTYEEYNQKVNKDKDKNYKKFYEHSKSHEYSIQYMNNVSHYYMWEYNYIVGYIKIILEKNDIVMEVYICDKSKFYFNSKSKNIIQPYIINDCHFYVSNMDEHEIKNKIREKIKEIQNILGKKYKLEMNIFNNQIENIDLNKIFDDLKALE